MANPIPNSDKKFNYYINNREVDSLFLNPITENEILRLVNSTKMKYGTREGFLRKNIVAVLFFQNCDIHPIYLIHIFSIK